MLRQFTLVWVDRKGVEQPLPAPSREYFEPELSPDGQTLAVYLQDQGIWLYDLVRGSFNKVVSAIDAVDPFWTPDGKRIIYSQLNGTSIFWVAADGSDAPALLARVDSGRKYAESLSADGKLLMGADQVTGQLWAMRLGEGSRPEPILESPSQKGDAMVSPDGHWVAYQSNETGETEIYVAAYPGPGGKFPISNAGGMLPRWARTGRELFYRNGDKLMAVDIQTSPTFHAGTPRVVFTGDYMSVYDLSPDGKRFLMVKPPADRQKAPMDQVTVVLNWFEELRQRVPPAR